MRSFYFFSDAGLLNKFFAVIVKKLVVIRRAIYLGDKFILNICVIVIKLFFTRDAKLIDGTFKDFTNLFVVYEKNYTSFF